MELNLINLIFFLVQPGTRNQTSELQSHYYVTFLTQVNIMYLMIMLIGGERWVNSCLTDSEVTLCCYLQPVLARSMALYIGRLRC